MKARRPAGFQLVENAIRRGDHWSSADFATQNLFAVRRKMVISLREIRKPYRFSAGEQGV